MIVNQKISYGEKDLPQTLIDRQDKVALCYGHFNVIHPGHLRYLQYAKTQCDRLVIAVIGDQSLKVSSESTRHYSEKERAEGVANLLIVDYVVILTDSNLDELINKIHPNVMILGREFESEHNQVVDNLINIVEGHGGAVVYHAGEPHYANTDLLYGDTFELEDKKIGLFRAACKQQNIALQNIQYRISQFNKAKLLIIGDTILDRYVACDALGMSAEAPVLVVKELDEREYIGGAAVVASHAQSLGAKCHYLSVVGDDEQAVVVDKLLSDFNVDRELIPDNSRPTTYKTRYMVENQKLFRVSRLQDHHISKKIEDILIDKIRKISVDVDGIIISDFVYGVITDRVIDVVKEVSECNGLMLYGDLQCSSQVGKVTKFREFNFIAPTEKEARIALDDQDAGIEWAAKTIMDQMLVDNMLMKLGSDGFIAYERVKNSYVQRQHFPAISVNPVDVTGAGDSLLASMTVCLSSGANLMEASAIGACMASLAVQEVGNVPITHEKLSRYIEMIMK